VARDLSDLKKALNAQERSNAQLQEEIADRQRIEEALRDSEEQLRLLSYRILSAQEEERKRIAVELHDSIGSSLGAVKYSMENILNQIQQGMPAHESIQYSIGVIRHAIEEVRRMHTDLRPSILDDLGIIATIDWFCRLFRTIHPNMLVEKEIGTKENEVPETLKIVIFRIIQESFHNIAKYSKARCVGVSLTQIGGVIELIVKDNGVGFDLTSDQHEGTDGALERVF
jgi:signal transduction histidine kinase